jgi:hypothetical protein
MHPFIIIKARKGGVKVDNKKKYGIYKTTNGYGNLRVAILEQAIKDYKRALRRGNNYKITALERWFLSEWGELLSGNNGAYIIEKVKKEIAAEQNANYCVCCGDVIPEGRQVCPKCEREVKK